MNPSNAYVLTRLGDRCRVNKDWDGAIEYYEKVLTLNDKDMFALTGLGDCYRGKERSNEAIEVWKKIISITPSNKYILGRLGDVLRKEKNWQDAIFYYEKVLKIDPKDLYALTGLYCVYLLGLTDNTKASEIESRITKIDSSQKILLMKLGDAYKHERRFAEAEECFRKLLTIDPTNESALNKLREIK